MKKTKKIPNTPKYTFGGGFDSKDKANVRNFIGNSAKMYADTALNAVGVDAFGAGKGVEYKGTSANKFNQASNVTGAVSKAVAPAVANVLLPGSGQVLSMGQQVAGGAYGKFGPQNEQGFNAYDADGNPIMNEGDNSAQVAQIAGQVGGIASGFMGGSPGGGAAAGMFARYGGQMKFAMGGEEPIREYASKDSNNNINYYKKVNTPNGPRFYTSSSPDMSTAQKMTNFKIIKNSADSIPMNKLPLDVQSRFGNFAMGGMQYANGGTGEINAEVEKEENAVGPNNEFTQFNGPSHSQGGIKTDMAPGTRVFSDKLKAPGTNKTFAKLNAGNNTNREDKLDSKEYLDPKSKTSIDLIRMAKTKNSDMLFAMQEQLKKDKVAAYARRMGVELPSMDNEQMEPQGMPEQSEGEAPMAKYGGMYSSGGIHINPANKGKFTASAQHAGMGTQEFANHVLANKEDYSSTQVKRANFAHNAAGWKHEMGGMQPYAMGGVQLPYYNINRDGTNKYAMGGMEVDSEMPAANTGTTSPTVSTPPQFGNRSDWEKYYTSQGWAKDPRNKSGVNVNLYDTNKYKYNQETDSFKFANNEPVPFNRLLSSDLMEFKPGSGVQKVVNKKAPVGPQSLNKWDFNSGIPTKRYYNESGELLKSEEYDNAGPSGKVLNTIEPRKKLAYGGKLPKYTDGIKTPKTNSIIMQDNGAPSIVPTSPDGSMANPTSAFTLDSNAIGDENNNFQWNFKGGNYTKPDSHTSYGLTPPKRPNDPDEDSFNWKDALEKVGNFAAQNAGNIYNLSRYNKPEVETYERAQAKYLDPTQARNDEQYNYRQSLENVRTGSMGSGATLLANTNAARNRTSVNTARINKEYENANAQIGNENNRYNTELAYRETIANAQNRARNRSGKGEAIGDIGEKFGMATKANKQGNMDQNTLELMMKYYNTPEFQKMMKDNKFKK